MSHTPEGMKNEGILPKSNKDIYQFLGHIKISFNVQKKQVSTNFQNKYRYLLTFRNIDIFKFLDRTYRYILTFRKVLQNRYLTNFREQISIKFIEYISYIFQRIDIYITSTLMTINLQSIRDMYQLLKHKYIQTMTRVSRQNCLQLHKKISFANTYDCNAKLRIYFKDKINSRLSVEFLQG